MSSKATFNAAAEETINKALAVCDQRGGEYNDSWALEHIKTPFLDNTLDYLTREPYERPVFDARDKRLIVLASLIDVKISRLVGPYKEDSSVDLINYVAAYNTLRLLHEQPPIDVKQQSAERDIEYDDWTPGFSILPLSDGRYFYTENRPHLWPPHPEKTVG